MSTKNLFQKNLYARKAIILETVGKRTKISVRQNILT